MPQIATLPTTRPIGLVLNYKLAGDSCERDNPHVAGTVECICQVNPSNADVFWNNTGFSSDSTQKHPISGCGTVNYKNASIYPVSMPQTLKTVGPLNIRDSTMEIPKPQNTAENSYTVTPCSDGYKKPLYVVLVGDRVRKCNTKLYASLPLQNKYMVKQRVQDSTGATRIKLILKSNHERYVYRAIKLKATLLAILTV